MFFFGCCSRWERRCSLGARHLVGADVGCVNRRSVAGESLLWFALGGGPPDFWKVPGLPAAIGLGLCRAGFGIRRPAQKPWFIRLSRSCRRCR